MPPRNIHAKGASPEPRGPRDRSRGDRESKAEGTPPRYKTEWSAASRAAIARRRAGRATHERPETIALDERAAVQELVEATLPWAALALLPAMALFEAPQIARCLRTFDLAALECRAETPVSADVFAAPAVTRPWRRRDPRRAMQ